MRVRSRTRSANVSFGPIPGASPRPPPPVSAIAWAPRLPRKGGQTHLADPAVLLTEEGLLKLLALAPLARVVLVDRRPGNGHDVRHRHRQRHGRTRTHRGWLSIHAAKKCLSSSGKCGPYRSRAPGRFCTRAHTAMARQRRAGTEGGSGGGAQHSAFFFCTQRAAVHCSCGWTRSR
jgi:hypothetical protein